MENLWFSDIFRLYLVEWRRSAVFVDFEHISRTFLVSMILNMQIFAGQLILKVFLTFDYFWA